MRNLFIAGTIVALTATAAQAESVSSGGIISMIKPDTSIEYGIKTKKWSGDVGVTAAVAGISIRPAADFSYTSGNAVALDGFSVKGTMPISSSLSAYSKLSMTNKMKYSDVTLGVAFSF